MVNLNLSLQVKLLRLALLGLAFFTSIGFFPTVVVVGVGVGVGVGDDNDDVFDDFMTALSLDDIQTMLLSGASNKISKKFEKELQTSLKYQYSSVSHC